MRTRTALLLSGCLLALPALAQTSSTISNLPSASTPLSGTEVFPVVQSGATKKVSASNLLPLSGVTAGTYGDATHCASFTVGANGLITSASQDTSCPGSAGGVTSVFGRTGDVVATSGDYAFSQLSSIPTTVSGYGITDAVTLTGTQSPTNKSLDFSLNTATKIPLSAFTNLGTTTTVLHGNASGSPTFGAINLGTDITGTLGVANGGTGITSLGTGVAAFWGTPSSANLRAALTDEVGTGAAYFVGGALSTPASGNASNLTNIPVAQATGVLPAANGGAGTASGILKANGSGTVSAAVAGTDYASASVVQNAQTGTSYATLATDGGKVVSLSNASAIAVSLSQANQTGFTAGFGTEYDSIGAGTTTITATTSVFDNGLTTLALTKGQDAYVWSDGTNYHSVVSVPVLAADNILGNFSGTSNYPIAGAIPNCANDGAHGLVYSTSTHAFACSSISGGSATPGGSTTQIQVNNAGAFGGVSTLSVDLTNGYLTNSANGAASNAAFVMNGTLFTGGTGTTTFPYFLIDQGTDPTSWSTSGTMIGLNAPTSFGGKYLDFHKDGGATQFSIGSNGDIATGSNITSGDNAVYAIGARTRMASSSNGEIHWQTAANVLFASISNTDGIKFVGTIPTVTGTGTPTIATGSTDTSGEVIAGASATSVVITFAAAKTNAPFCVVTPQTHNSSFDYAVSTTAITITQTAAAEKINYDCVQH